MSRCLEYAIAARHQRHARLADVAAVEVEVPNRAVRRTAIAAFGIGVVAGLEAFDTAIATGQHCAARTALWRAIPERLFQTRDVAAIAAHAVAVVALFVPEHDLITATGQTGCGGWTDPSGFERAGGTAVAVFFVAVVTGFARSLFPVTALLVDARRVALTGTEVPVLHLTRVRAAIVALLVAVVTGFAAIDRPVAAAGFDETGFARPEANPAVLDRRALVVAATGFGSVVARLLTRH